MCCICVCLFVHLCVFYLRVCVCVECSFLHSVPAPPIAFLMASIHVQITNGLLLLDSCYVSNNSFNVTLFRFFFSSPSTCQLEFHLCVTEVGFRSFLFLQDETMETSHCISVASVCQYFAK